MQNRNYILITIILTLGLMAGKVAPNAFGVSPPPDGGYPNFTTAEGLNALRNLTTGAGNTGLGWYSLFSDTAASFNTGVGAGTLALNTGDENTAVGTAALLLNTASGNTAVGSRALLNNTTGGTLGNIQGLDVGPNVAVGQQALESNTVASANTAVGYQALHSFRTGPVGAEQLGACTAVGFQALGNATGDGWGNGAFGYQALLNNTTGQFNTAIGLEALFSNTEGDFNTANGVGALDLNTTGFQNTALGVSALQSNTGGSDNTAIGNQALGSNITGNENTAIGFIALNNSTGNNNVALGSNAGFSLTTASNVICIGRNVGGENVDNSCYIGNVFNQTSASGIQVFVNSNDKLGTITSSKRFKEEIKPMEQASEALLALKPVTFRYKKEIDPVGTSQFGLVAEDVEKVNPDLVVHDKEGKPYSVRYDQVNAMLLNEFLKAHKAFLEEQRKVQEQDCRIQEQDRRIQEQETTIAELSREVETVIAHAKAQDSKIEKVSAQVQLNKSVSQVADNQR